MQHGILSAGIENGGHLDLQDLAIVSTKETSFHVALVYWSRPANGC